MWNSRSRRKNRAACKLAGSYDRGGGGGGACSQLKSGLDTGCTRTCGTLLGESGRADVAVPFRSGVFQLFCDARPAETAAERGRVEREEAARGWCREARVLVTYRYEPAGTPLRTTSCT